MVYKRRSRITRKRYFSVAQAKEYIGDLEKNTEVFGLTHGQFSIIDLIEYVLNTTGKANVMLATWTAANADIKKAFSFLKNNKIANIRFLVDRGFRARQPEYCEDLVTLFGRDSIRFLNLHAKFVVIQNSKWNFVIRSSMNLNENKRIENFEITEDKDFCEYFIKFFKMSFDQVDPENESGKVEQLIAFDDSSLSDINF